MASLSQRLLPALLLSAFLLPASSSAYCGISKTIKGGGTRLLSYTQTVIAYTPPGVDGHATVVVKYDSWPGKSRAYEVREGRRASTQQVNSRVGEPVTVTFHVLIRKDTERIGIESGLVNEEFHPGTRIIWQVDAPACGGGS